MEKKAEFSIRSESAGSTAVLAGDWTADSLGDAPARLAQTLKASGEVGVDIRKVRRLDTAGAYALVRAVGHDYDLKKVQARPESERLLELVGAAVHIQPVTVAPPRGFHELTVRIGKGVMDVGYEWIDTLAFLGHLLVVVARSAGYLFTAQFAASMMGMLSSGALVRRHGYRLTLVQGLILMADSLGEGDEASNAYEKVAACCRKAGTPIVLVLSKKHKEMKDRFANTSSTRVLAEKHVTLRTIRMSLEELRSNGT